MYTMASGSKQYFAVLFLLVVSATATGAIRADTTPVNVSDPHIQSLGRFAVAEYSKKNKLDLYFIRVYGGHSDFYGSARATSYFLDLIAGITCSQSGALRNYTASLTEQWYDDQIHTSFNSLYPKYT